MPTRSPGLYAQLDKAGNFIAEVVKENSFGDEEPRRLLRLFVTPEPELAWNEIKTAYYVISPHDVNKRWTVTAIPDAEAYAMKLAEGYTDATTGKKLKTTESAQAEFTKQNSLYELALKKGAVTESTEVTFWDFEDNPHVLTLSEYQNLLLRYGLYCQYLYANFAP